ncbi:MAG: hypothetical protein ACE5EX_05770 [Phycisphaerae bacterium]
MASEEVTSTCESCGASVYQEHLTSGIARYEGGKLLCTHCVAEYEETHDATRGGVTEELAPIVLEGHEDSTDSASEMSSTRIHGMSAATLLTSAAWNESRFKRALEPQGTGATRCRLFHCKLSEGAVEYVNNQINDWLDANEQITIKFATSTIGMFEGKHTEPNLIMTLFY